MTGHDEQRVVDPDAEARTFFRYFESKLDLIMARSGPEHATIGRLLAERPADEGLLESVRAAVVGELERQLADPSVVREMQVMLTTPSLRKLAREHFDDEEAELVVAVADRLGVDADDLTAQVTAGAIGSALWTTINRWLADGSDLDRLGPMMDEALAVLATGLGK